MAGACTFPPQVNGSSLEISRTGTAAQLNRACTPYCYWKIARKSSGAVACSDRNSATLAEGPSCIFVGPIETANQELLEALYRQARDAYYSGKPLIVDDMFDKVEVNILYISGYTDKIGKCVGRSKPGFKNQDWVNRPNRYVSDDTRYVSLICQKKQGNIGYISDDMYQVLALASVWIVLLVFGSLALLVPTIYTIKLAYQDAVNPRFPLTNASSAVEFLAIVNGILFMGLGSVIGYPIASASVRALQRMWTNDLVALKGSCPNCGEEVFAFVQTDKLNQSPHRADCHVCECTLEFRTKVEQSILSAGRRRWVYGRIYLVPGTTTKRRRWT